MRKIQFILLLLAALPAITIAQEWKAYPGVKEDGSPTSFYIDIDSIQRNGVLALVKYRVDSGSEGYFEFDCTAKTGSIRRRSSPPSSVNPANDLGVISENSLFYSIGEYICSNRLRRLLM